MIHCTEAADAGSPCWIEGTATLTIVTSSSDMNPTSRVTARARHRLRCASRECWGLRACWGVDIRVCGYPGHSSGNCKEVEDILMSDQPTVALLGTGIMGTGMGRNIVAAGMPLQVWNRTREKAAPLQEAGATVADSPADAVRGADVVITMLFDTDSVEETLREAADGL